MTLPLKGMPAANACRFSAAMRAAALSRSDAGDLTVESRTMLWPPDRATSMARLAHSLPTTSWSRFASGSFQLTSANSILIGSSSC
jgi:hypothetical protein